MLCRSARLVRRVGCCVVRALRAAVRWLTGRLRAAWEAHLERLAHDARYAAAIVTVAAGLLGDVPVPELAAAVLAAVLSAYLNRHRRLGT